MRYATSHRDQAIIMTLLDTGLRASELSALKAGFVAASRRMRRRRRTRVPLFLVKYDRPMNKNALRLVIVHIGEKAGVKRCSIMRVLLRLMQSRQIGASVRPNSFTLKHRRRDVPRSYCAATTFRYNVFVNLQTLEMKRIFCREGLTIGATNFRSSQQAEAMAIRIRSVRICGIRQLFAGENRRRTADSCQPAERL